MDLIQLSRNLLLSARTNLPAGDDSLILASLREPVLEHQLPDDNLKKSFWINLYNAYTQLLLSAGPDRYSRKTAFFSNRQITVAGKTLSLDDIEHGLLRRSKLKWAFGYLQNPFPGRFERNHRVDALDFRIHFALNCGAASCPPIAWYDPVRLNDQLDLAMLSYLQAEAAYDPATNVLHLPAVIAWYRKDFAVLNSVKQLLQSLSLIPADRDLIVRFKQYNWNLYLRNYVSEQDTSPL